MDVIEVYGASSKLAIAGQTGIVEKIIIGANNSVSYQMICHTPERHQVIVNNFEVTPIEGQATKRQVGFSQAKRTDDLEVTVIVSEDNSLIDISAKSGVTVGVKKLNTDDAIKYRSAMELGYDKAKDTPK